MLADLPDFLLLGGMIVARIFWTVAILTVLVPGIEAQDKKPKDSPLVAKTRKKLLTPVTVDYKDERLEDVLKDLKKQLDEEISFWSDNQGGVSNNPTITYKAKDKPLAEVLDEMFKTNDLGYLIGKPKHNRYEGWILIKRGKLRGDEEDGKPGPGTRPDKVKPSDKPADKPADKPEDAAEKMERDAARLLKLAKMLAADGLTDKAKARYQEIVKKYPSTRAAKEAKELLEK
jgi:hypothetical protein